MKMLIKNIKQIFGVSTNGNTNLKRGNDMSLVEIIENGWILIEDDVIADFGEMKNFTGIDSPYEEPIDPEITIKTKELGVDASAKLIVDYYLKFLVA